MNALNPEQAMNSLQITELVNARHDSVKRTIERLADQEVIQLPPMVEVENIQSLSPNKMTNCYLFSGEQGKLDSITVVAQLCPQFTAAIVKRWQELERNLASSETIKLETYMANLAQGMASLLKQNNLTHKYIALLESNQKGKRRIKREDEATIKQLRAEGMSQSDIARLLRISPTAVSQIIHGRYPFSKNAKTATLGIGELLENMIKKEAAQITQQLVQGEVCE